MDLYISHPLLKENTVEKRAYQDNILKTAREKNTLVVLPTGMGKTIIALLLAIERLEKFPEEKVLILAPTRPLVSQHKKVFEELTTIEKDSLKLITGTKKPEKREKEYKDAKIVFSTPQTVENDLKEGRLSLEDFCLLVVDEAHRSVGNYSYTYVAKKYMTQAKHPLILALTASPGSDKEKIEEICRNLFIRNVEIKTEDDPDVKPYIKPVIIDVVKVSFSPDLERIREKLKEVLKEKKERLKELGFRFTTKKELLDLQKKIGMKASQGEKQLYGILMLIADTIKIWHAIELLETQSVTALKKYMEKLAGEKSKRIFSDSRIRDVYFDVMATDEMHPKMEKLIEIVKKELEHAERILIFSHYRSNIEKIYEELKKVEGCKPCYLVGQAGKKGLSQKEQIETIRRFEEGECNCLIGSPVSEEGLHIPSVDVGIFYDAVPSAIRLIQRRGRIGRVKMGKVIFLLLKNSRDEAYFYTALRKEKMMKKFLKDLKQWGLDKRTLYDFR